MSPIIPLLSDSVALLLDQTSHNYNYHSSTAEATSGIPLLPAEQQQQKHYHQLLLLFKGFIRLLYQTISFSITIYH
jgi:hypothetical protein